MIPTAEKSNVQKVKEAIRKFRTTQHTYRSHGAEDSEPCAVFYKILRDAVNGKDSFIPQTGEGWELYAFSMDCREAADALHLAALGVLQAVFACTVGDMRELREYVSGII